MATDTSTFSEDPISIDIDLSDVMISSMSANGINYQDLYSVTMPTTGGYTYTTTGTNTVNPWITVNDGHNSLSVQGDADFAGDVRVKGRSLAEFMEQVEQRLNMLQPNPDLEQEWDELRELGERYRELERRCKEKGEMWKKLKQMPPPEVK
jgi:hypothetical protein